MRKLFIFKTSFFALILIFIISNLVPGGVQPVYACYTWSVGARVGLAGGTQIRAGSGLAYTVHTTLPADANNWQVDIIGEPRYLNIAGSRKGLFNYDGVLYHSEPILIVKGEIAAALLVQHGFLACAPTGGEGSQPEEVRTAVALADKRIVVGDNDRDPRVAEKTRLLAEKRATLYYADLVFPPPEYKDIDEYLLAEEEAALATIQQWIGD
ncbi:MAG: hypothetical protein M1281_14930 [Chloroflexi bacterium]|nr:hypothetical protein [Chloroflexota bacterium]